MHSPFITRRRVHCKGPYCTYVTDLNKLICHMRQKKIDLCFFRNRSTAAEDDCEVIPSDRATPDLRRAEYLCPASSDSESDEQPRCSTSLPGKRLQLKRKLADRHLEPDISVIPESESQANSERERKKRRTLIDSAQTKQAANSGTNCEVICLER